MDENNRPKEPNQYNPLYDQRQLHDGYIQIIMDGIWGYADIYTGKIIVEPVYDYAGPYYGFGMVNIGGISTVSEEGWIRKDKRRESRLLHKRYTRAARFVPILNLL